MAALTAVSLILVGWLLSRSSFSGRATVVLALTAPLLVYLVAIGGIDLSVGRAFATPLRYITWDCLDVVAVPLALVVPFPQAAAVCTVTTAAAPRPGGFRPPMLNRFYGAAVDGLALTAAGATGRVFTRALPGAVGTCLAVALSVLIFELVTFAAQIVILPRRAPHIRVIARPAALAIPAVITLAAGLTLAYERGAYISAAILALIPVFIVGLMHRFGRTTLALEERQKEKDEILRVVVETAEQQRGSVAADIHDGPLQSILACQALLSDAADSADAGGFSRAQDWLSSAAAELRTLVRGLAPEVLTQLGLEQAICQAARMLSRPPHQTISVSCELEDRLDPGTELILYRVAHEALMNAVKHSGARHVVVQISMDDDEVQLAVADDGRGGAVGAHNESLDGHVGLAMMQERIRLAGGSFALENASDGGTRVTARLPAHPDDDDAPPSRAARMAKWWGASIPVEAAMPNE